MMRIGVELAFKAVLSLVDAFRHHGVSDTAHEGHSASRDLLVELLHTAIELSRTLAGPAARMPGNSAKD